MRECTTQAWVLLWGERKELRKTIAHRCTETALQESIPTRTASTSACRQADRRKYAGRHGSPPAARGSRRARYRTRHKKCIAPVRFRSVNGRHLTRISLGILEGKGLGRAGRSNDGGSSKRRTWSVLGARSGRGMLHCLDVDVIFDRSLTAIDAGERMPRMAAERGQDEVPAATPRDSMFAFVKVEAVERTCG